MARWVKFREAMGATNPVWVDLDRVAIVEKGGTNTRSDDEYTLVVAGVRFNGNVAVKDCPQLQELLAEAKDGFSQNPDQGDT